MTPGFTDAEWERLLTHLGYGNPHGALWFMGMEEHLEGDRDSNLRWRLDNFTQAVSSFETHLRAPWLRGKLPRTDTWPTMARIARSLIDGAHDWSDLQKAKDYITTRLATSIGDTFLIELSPLPNTGIKNWAYSDRFPGGRRQYEGTEMPRRLQQLRDFTAEHKPYVIICYGTGYWPQYRRVFALDDFKTCNFGSVNVGVGHWLRSTVILTPFFDRRMMPTAAIGRIRELL